MKLFKVITTLAVSCSLLSLPIISHAAKPKNMSVHFIDVGQGDSIYIKAPNGEDIIIDGGNKDGSDVVTYLKKQKVDDIEIMIATHPDADHIGGLDEVLAAYKVEQIYAPKVSHTTEAYKDFLNAVKKEKVKIQTAKSGVELKIKDVTAKFVAPVKEYGKDLNNWSAVLHVTYGKNTFLFTGDAEEKSEKDMINSKQKIKAEVLKVGHHGAKETTTDSFLKTVQPKYAVISVGAKNSYKHPTNEVLNRLKKVKATVYRTDKHGSIVFTSDGKKLSIKTEKKG
jgi:competence protein ComEC